MTEFCNHKAYKLLNEDYKRVCLDYVILHNNEEYDGLQTHKKAVFDAIAILNKRFSNDDSILFFIDNENMLVQKISIDEFLELPPDNYNVKKSKSDRSFSIKPPIPYWFAFLEPPSTTPYTTDDFVKFNNILFPNKEDLEVYRWNDDFSNYFDEGKEWWGTGLWSVYDKSDDLLIIIGASLSD